MNANRFAKKSRLASMISQLSRGQRVSRFTLGAALGLSAVATLPTTVFAAEEPKLEEVLVTGSHIRRDTFTSSSPISVMNSEAIEGVGTVNMADLIARIPSAVGDTTTSSSNIGEQDTGLNTIALRNLGSSRTLVLLNGRRYVSGVSPGTGYGVDLNSIPTAMVERVEVLTGGQSAAYGSDAVAGVINIITKTDFEGVQLNVQSGQSGEGDREKQDFTLSLGKNFGDGGNAWVSLGYSDDEGLLSTDRSFSRVHKSTSDSDGDGLRDSLAFVGSSHIPSGRIAGFKGDGSAFVRTTDVNTSDAFNFHEFRSMLIPVERKFLGAGLSFNLSDKAKATLRANYARVDIRGRFEPIPLDTRNNIFEVSRGGSTGINLDPALGAVHPLFDGTPLQASMLAAGTQHLDDASLTFRRLVEFGDRGAGVERSTFRVAGAFDYEFDNDLFLNIYATYGVTDHSQQNFGDINLERARFALDLQDDGFGGYQCADEIARIDGCVPFNPFNIGGDPNQDPLGVGISPEAVDYLAAATGLEGTIEQLVISSVLSGDLPFSIGTTDENLAFAFGLEYREEQGEETPDGLRQNGIVRGNRLSPTDGSFDVFDIFGELQVPLHEKLNLDVAFRVGDYSSVGNTTTWKIGLDAPLSESIRLRAAQARAVRAPNISDLFGGQTATSVVVFDPCNGIDGSSTGNVADNCRSISAIQSRIDSDGAFILTQVESQNTSGLVGGNPDVEEEEADSTTVGVVFTPTSVEGFSLALDWYDIEIEDAIAKTDRTVILNRCHEIAPSNFDPSCGGLVRRDIRAGAALEANSSSGNENIIETSGIDLEASYFTALGGGDIFLSVIANYLDKYEITGIETGDVQELDGEILFPEWRFNVSASYTLNNWNVYWQLRYWDETKDRNETPDNYTSSLNSIDSVVYNDLRVSYQFSDRFNVYLGGNNIFDEDPPLLGADQKYQQQGTLSNGSAFDLTGSQWYAGVKVTF